MLQAAVVRIQQLNHPMLQNQIECVKISQTTTLVSTLAHGERLVSFFQFTSRNTNILVSDVWCLHVSVGD